MPDPKVPTRPDRSEPVPAWRMWDEAGRDVNGAEVIPLPLRSEEVRRTALRTQVEGLLAVILALHAEVEAFAVESGSVTSGGWCCRCRWPSWGCSKKCWTWRRCAWLPETGGSPRRSGRSTGSGEKICYLYWSLTDDLPSDPDADR